VEPAVAAEEFVGGFAGQCDRGAFPYRPFAAAWLRRTERRTGALGEEPWPYGW